MNQKHKSLVQSAIKAADRVHSDMSVTSGETLSSLKEIRAHVHILIESVRSDLQMQEDEE